MLRDLFSSFDPQTNILGANIFIWVITIISPLIYFSIFWTCINIHTITFLKKISFIKLQAFRTFSLNLPGLPHIIIVLFLFFSTLNLLGLFPYVFRATSHLIFTFTFGLPFWAAIIISRARFSPSYFLASLLPGGAPSWLNPFLTLIETVRTTVQPGTLSFRIAANIRAGHIVIGLLALYLIIAYWELAWKAIILLALIHVGYLLFEGGISVVQRYIFCLLLTLYSDNHSHWLSAI